VGIVTRRDHSPGSISGQVLLLLRRIGALGFHTVVENRQHGEHGVLLPGNPQQTVGQTFTPQSAKSRAASAFGLLHCRISRLPSMSRVSPLSFLRMARHRIWLLVLLTGVLAGRLLLTRANRPVLAGYEWRRTASGWERVPQWQPP